jgi:hypothetical protein
MPCISWIIVLIGQAEPCMAVQGCARLNPTITSKKISHQDNKCASGLMDSLSISARYLTATDKADGMADSVEASYSRRAAEVG